MTSILSFRWTSAKFMIHRWNHNKRGKERQKKKKKKWINANFSSFRGNSEINVIYRNTIGLATENTKGSQLEEMYAVCVYRTRCIGEIRPQLCS